MGTSSSPPHPYPGGTAGAEPPDPVAGSGGHFAWSRWVKQFLKNLDVQVVKRSGDEMTGPLSLSESPALPMHAATKAYVDTAQNAPVGMIGMFAGAVPTGWITCDGRLHNSPALKAYLGSDYVPDLRERFLVGASVNLPLKSLGGEAAVTLTAAQSGLPSHSHGVTVSETDVSHTHTGNIGSVTSDAVGSHNHGGNTVGMNTNQSHRHTATTYEGITTGDSDKYIDTADAYSPLTPRTGTVEIGYTNIDHVHGIHQDGGHSHSFTVGEFSTRATNPRHGHAASIASSAPANAAASHENRPPFYAVVLAMRS